jgi:hypothetical protein
MQIRFGLAILLVGQGLSLQAQHTAAPITEPSTWVIPASDELILQWLRSPDPRLEAWGAHFVLSQNRSELLPVVVSLAEQSITSPHQADLSRAIIAELDTIIQLDGTVPVESLEKLTVADNQRLILLNHLPTDQSNPLLLKLYQSSLANGAHPFDARISAQMLAQHPTAGFAASLLTTIRINTQIYLHDASSGGMSGGTSCGIGSGVQAPPRDWPAVGSYQFHDPPLDEHPIRPEWTLFQPAPDPIYLERSVSLDYSGRQTYGLSGLTDAIRSHLVGTLLGGSPSAPFPEEKQFLDIEFRDRDSYYDAVTKFVQGHEDNFAQVAWALTQRGVMTEEERQVAKLHVNLTIDDFRKSPAEELPEIPFRESVVQTEFGYLSSY